MHTRGPGLLTRGGVLDLTAKLESLIEDPDTASAVVVTIATAHTFDTAAGTTTTATTGAPITGYLAPLTLREVTDGPYQVGDVRLRVMASEVVGDLSIATTFTVQALDTHDATAAPYRVLSAVLDPLGIHWELIGSRSA